MFDIEAMKDKATTNGCVIQLFKHDSQGYRVYHSETLGYANAEVWPYSFAERIDHLLESGDVGFVYSMDTHGVWFAQVFTSRSNVYDNSLT